MADFSPGVTIESDEPAMEVTVTPDRPLLPGRHRFRLIVVDNDGLVSQPSDVDVIVRDERGPTAVLDVPEQVRFGESFVLDGRRSSDPPPGAIKLYRWTMLS